MRRTTLASVVAACAATLLAIGGVAVGNAAASPSGRSDDSSATADPTAATDTSAPSARPTPITTDTATTTLPLFGAPLTIVVESGPDGNLSSVSVDPADGLTANFVKPKSVRFVNEEGTVKVEVSSRHGQQKVVARAGQLSDISGPGGWSGDVFGNGTITSVGFLVGAAAGTPTITAVTTSDASAAIGDAQTDTSGAKQSARVSIRFENGGEVRVLSIKAEAWTDDGETRAKLSVSLSRVAWQAVPVADAIGAKIWMGTLCDGTAAQINYTVGEDGAVSAVTAMPNTAAVWNMGSHARVKFSEHERVAIKVRFKDDGLRVSIDERIRCRTADPTVNTPVAEPDADNGGRKGDGNHGDGNGRGGNGGGGNGRDGGGAGHGDGGRGHGDDDGDDDAG